ncbi:lipopolysaccharide biosynthesis protein [Roseomonas chloroacetimidivorans]|uniref:lipopolysaccharide biosynthesis protein n=1 Tax=Roseomonas chloroacetimidivorans TaxID=1766656 RepID=UPI003C753D03
MMRATWTIIDQGLVSVGTFLVSVLLARHLAPAEYGTYALLLGGMFALQLINATVLFHPLAVLLVLAQEKEQAQLLKTAVVLIAGVSIALGAALGLALLLLGRSDLILPALSCFLLWQVQEGMRRGLFAEFRHRLASLGDAVSYLGQVVVILWLATVAALDLPNALYAIALTSGLAALLQCWQLRIRLSTPIALRHTMNQFWAVGGFWSLGNGLLSIARFQILSWTLSISAGPAAVANLQAAFNIVNLSNPLITGLCNIIPQASAQASASGTMAAWRSTRRYLVLAAPALLTFSALVLIAPGHLLHFVYGSDSTYLILSPQVRLLIIATVAGYAADLVISFLHGLRVVPLAFAINAIGALTTAALAFALTGPFGITGSCVALIGANIARLIVTHVVLTRIAANEDRQPA